MPWRRGRDPQGSRRLSRRFSFLGKERSKTLSRFTFTLLVFLLLVISGCDSSGDTDLPIVLPPGTQQDLSVTLTPNQGPAGGGTLVSLLGPDVGEVTAISFGGLSVAGFDLVGPGHVELLTPPQKSGLVDVIVTTAQGSAVLEDAFEYLARPSVISIEPNQVPTGGASGVVITGSGFVEAATTVNIEGQAYTPSEMTATSLTFSAPAHEVGTVEVTVSTAGGTSDPVPAGLTYLERPIVAALTPSAGPLSGASGVVLTLSLIHI